MKTEKRKMKRRVLMILFLLPLALVSSFILAREWKQKSLERSAEKFPVYNEIDSFELTERSGARVGKHDLLGRVWIADFVFTRCGGPCPIMTAHMKNLETALAGQGVRLVTFTVDPDYDTPERLQVYANRFNAGSDSWLFLTGDKDTIYQLSRQHFLLGVTEIAEEDREAPEQAIMHSTRFALVDKLGRVRGYYESTEPGSLQRLARDAGALARARN